MFWIIFGIMGSFSVSFADHFGNGSGTFWSTVLKHVWDSSTFRERLGKHSGAHFGNGSLFGSFGDHFGVVFGLVWDQFRIIFGYFGMGLGLFRKRFANRCGTMKQAHGVGHVCESFCGSLGSSWDTFRTMVGVVSGTFLGHTHVLFGVGSFKDERLERLVDQTSPKHGSGSQVPLAIRQLGQGQPNPHSKTQSRIGHAWVSELTEHSEKMHLGHQFLYNPFLLQLALQAQMRIH